MENILKTHYTDGIWYTHVSMIQPKGKYQFNRESLEKFWESYSDYIKTEPIIGIAEKPQKYMPVLVDVDIKLKENEDEVLEYDEGEHIYSQTDVNTVVGIYQSIITQTVENCRDEHLTCIVLEKPVYTETKNNVTYIKNGFHLHFPNLFLNREKIEVQIIPRVQNEIREINLFGYLGIEDSGKTIDKSSCSNPWLLYGSRKSEESYSYKVTRVISADGSDISLEDAFKHYQIFDHKERLINIAGQVEKYLPRILSVIPYGRQTSTFRHGIVSPIKEQIREKHAKEYVKVSVTEALKISAKLIPMLAQYRTEDRNEWMTIGWILFNIGDGCEDALNQWLDFSSRDSENYDESTCIYEWERMIKKDFTLGTLRYFASIDSPEAYKKFKQEQSDKYVKDSLNGSHNDIAKILYEEYGSEFVCGSISNKTWYQFKDHRWEEIEEGIFLREKLSTTIAGRFIQMGQEEFVKAGTCTDKADQAMYAARIKQIQKIISGLKSAPYKNNVMREAMEVFYDKRFKEKLDQNPYLFLVKNGVYDLKLNIFRAGRPEDFLSTGAPINYRIFDESHEGVQEVHDYLEKVFVDEDIRRYFLDQTSDVFIGGNFEKRVNVWTGEGDNAKSVTQNIIEKMLGRLAIKFSTTLVTGKKTQAGSCAPELARAGTGGIRWATLEEPDGDEEVNTGLIKSLSGNDSYWARDLFEKGKATREMTPMFKLTFICNKLPRLKYADTATWNRFRVVPFESTFVRPGEPCPSSYEEQLKQKRFPMDKEFHKKIPDLLEPFLWVLLEHRKNMKVRIEPEKVKAATAMYRKKNDIYRQFVEECIIEDSENVLSLIELYNSFKNWYKEGFPNHQLPVKNEVKEYFVKLWDEPERGGRWRGYKIRTLQDDIDSGDCVVLGDEDLADYDEGKTLPPM